MVAWRHRSYRQRLSIPLSPRRLGSMLVSPHARTLGQLSCRLKRLASRRPRRRTTPCRSPRRRDGIFIKLRLLSRRNPHDKRPRSPSRLDLDRRRLGLWNCRFRRGHRLLMRNLCGLVSLRNFLRNSRRRRPRPTTRRTAPRETTPGSTALAPSGVLLRFRANLRMMFGKMPLSLTDNLGLSILPSALQSVPKGVGPIEGGITSRNRVRTRPIPMAPATHPTPRQPRVINGRLLPTAWRPPRPRLQPPSRQSGIIHTCRHLDIIGLQVRHIRTTLVKLLGRLGGLPLMAGAPLLGHTSRITMLLLWQVVLITLNKTLELAKVGHLVVPTKHGMAHGRPQRNLLLERGHLPFCALG